MTYENLTLAHFLDKADQLAACAEEVKALNAQVCLFAMSNQAFAQVAVFPHAEWQCQSLLALCLCLRHSCKLVCMLLSPVHGPADLPSQHLQYHCLPRRWVDACKASVSSCCCGCSGSRRVSNKKGSGRVTSLGPGAPLHSVSVHLNSRHQVSDASTRSASIHKPISTCHYVQQACYPDVHRALQAACFPGKHHSAA